ncbi:methyltransferase [Pseudomonas koreensis]|uniref:class I SAM-dependent methyltransferase n=1 Tax=Pseudomonas koreensis TaxID=198620 RepID=UPI0021C58602|nr:class I SAM-dependent methyltransferase [Pseudomonas koreensis]MCU0070647.1 methyltransferase [Pseudomonas koreensis]
MTELRAPFPNTAFASLAAQESRHWWFRSRNRIILWAMKKHIRNFNSFLEVGCGTAFVLEGVSNQFPGIEISGSEYFEEGLVHARNRLPTANFMHLDATKMSDESRYDVIGTFDVIEHIEEDQLVLNNLAKAIKPGGTLLVSVPQHRWLWSEADTYACHVRRYTRQELISKVEKSGLKVEYATSFVTFLVPLMWLSRKKTKSGEYDPMQEFRIPSWLNFALESVMKLELLLLKAGINLPVGGSLLLVANKK